MDRVFANLEDRGRRARCFDDKMKITISRRKVLVFALVFSGLAPSFAAAQSVDDLAKRVNGIQGAPRQH